MLFLNAKFIDLDLGANAVIVNEEDLKGTSYYPQDRVLIESHSGSVLGILYSTKTMVQKGEVGIPVRKMKGISLKEGEEVNLRHAEKPESIQFIKKKMDGQVLSPNEIRTIIDEIVSKKLSNIELAAFVTSTYVNGMNMEEIVEMTKRMAETGDMISWEKSLVVDIHSIGGVPGNKYALLSIPILAAAGITIPKTSSRAITSPAGTADVMEVLTNVELDEEELKRVVKATNGCLVWGGGVNLAPADDIIINVERPVSIDPQPQLLASVMAKKVATGIKYAVIDIPVGKGVKIKNEAEGAKLARKFIELGELLNIRVECVLTYGGQPLGRAIGPALEAKEALEALTDPKSAPKSLIEKAISLAGILLELGGSAQIGDGQKLAWEILESGRALEKFNQIIVEQGGTPKKPEEIELGKYVEEVRSPIDGYIVGINNTSITNVVKEAGAPRDKKAGLLLNAKIGNKVKRGDILYTIYSGSEERLNSAVNLARRVYPVNVEGMMIERISKF
ncbi:putative thymidine phosphorylase [Methanococcus vannielii SB]|uniref:AMP phosphorylase n=1 Tax=Methanococcus vannielii (strain ATCC 35089 / DSM 1224 / JCM 13029 / OCM 148 / SB) TaxID=406327 RepID=AMPPA_METVS|nr:AMP phosphorylase [Methanococcus vannielii]A6URW3.1 RecName: Full=AMP phosphorylase; Short=AMPpase; AltName: Full=Nucleoside monophosphate phosphorylase; Short=NMP phosphorylase [Methanococcus vannielii SB]ABR55235.1 putative thymidine phosphorylase [Methanococcus vannielii SB]